MATPNALRVALRLSGVLTIAFVGVVVFLARYGLGVGPDSLQAGLQAAIKLTKRYDVDLQTCVDNFEIQRDQIIRTQDSKRMGAVNLAVKDVLTRDECLRLCCETDKCDVFVFEEKQVRKTICSLLPLIVLRKREFGVLSFCEIALSFDEVSVG